MKAECKKSFVLYVDYKRHLDLIEDAEEYRALFDAIFQYCATGYEPENLSPIAMMAFSFIKTNIDRDCAKYDKVREKRRKAGSLGGKAKSSNAKQNVASASNAKQDVANVAVTATVTATGTGTVTDIKENTLMPLSEASEFKGLCPASYHPKFETFWIAYPSRNGKKNGKRKAFESWWKVVRDKLSTPDELVVRIIQLAPTYGDYAKDASTWLNGRGWEDEVTKGVFNGKQDRWNDFNEQHRSSSVEITEDDDIASALRKYGL